MNNSEIKNESNIENNNVNAICGIKVVLDTSLVMMRTNKHKK